ncbi:MAG: hypothetical protein H6Q12_218 [Bacteroidetes bacterium]|nr:hypothetical protein [Bacteroidota bacterium]
MHFLFVHAPGDGETAKKIPKRVRDEAFSEGKVMVVKASLTL